MSGNKNNQELNLEDMDKVAGGIKIKNPFRGKGCSHPNKVKTGNVRKGSFLYIFKIDEYEYHCPDCGTIFWD